MAAPQPQPLVSWVEADRLRMLWAESGISAQARGPHYQFFSAGQAIVAYVEAGSAWVAAGPPMAADTAAMVEAAAAFDDAARRVGRRPVFFGITKAHADLFGLRFVAVGEEAHFCPQAWPPTSGRRSKSLLAQLRRASHRGVTVARAAASGDAAAATAVEAAAITRAWQAQHAMPPMGFVVGLQPLGQHRDDALWVARHNGRLVAYAVVLPVGSHGVLIEHIVRAPEAANGTAELLVSAVMSAHRHKAFVSLGLSPLAGELWWPLAWARRLGRVLYNFSGLRAFKEKLQPARWQTLGVGYGGRGLGTLKAAKDWPTPRLLALVDVLRAFAHGNLSLFLCRLLLRGPKPVLVALTAALPFWMLGLYSLDAAAWFVASWMQAAWLWFDGALFVGLCLALRGGHAAAFAALACIVSCDALVTLVEVLAFRSPEGWIACALRMLAVLAPAISAALLWGAYLRSSSSSRCASRRAKAYSPRRTVTM